MIIIYYFTKIFLCQCQRFSGLSVAQFFKIESFSYILINTQGGTKDFYRWGGKSDVVGYIP